MNTFHQHVGFFFNQTSFSSKQKRIFEFLRQEKQDKISLVCIFAHNFEELAKRRGHSEITSFYCWLFSDLAAPRFLSCLCFGIKQTWSNYLRSRKKRGEVGTFCRKTMEIYAQALMSRQFRGTKEISCHRNKIPGLSGPSPAAVSFLRQPAIGSQISFE